MIRTASTFDMSEECANQIDKDYMLDKLYQSSDSGVESVNLFELSSPILADGFSGAFLFLFLIFLVTSFSLSLSLSHNTSVSRSRQLPLASHVG